MALKMRGVQRTEQRAPVRRMIRTSANRFDVDLSRKPDGVTYEWKVATVAGQEDVEGMINAEVNGWVPVPPERHPELVGSRAVAGGQIKVGGQILMERPEEVTEQSRGDDEFLAGVQLTHQLQRLRSSGKTGKGVQRKYEPVTVDD